MLIAIGSQGSPCWLNVVLMRRGKVVLVGDSGVGKTQLAAKLQRDAFSAEHTPTVGIDVVVAMVGDHDPSSPCPVHIWDTAGQRAYRSLTRILDYEGTDAIIVVFDVTVRSSFDAIASEWIPDLRSVVSNDIPIAILGTKLDLAESSRQQQLPRVPIAEIRNYAATAGLIYLGDFSLAHGQQSEIQAAVAAAMGRHVGCGPK